MLNKYFDHCYLINLEERYDRLARAAANCSMIGLTFERFPAVSYTTVDEIKDCKTIVDEVVKRDHWTKGAVALIRTTVEIIKDAKAKGYKSILILEDDVEFKQDIGQIVSQEWKNIPEDWEMIQFAGLHTKPYNIITNNLAQTTGSECLHAYAINENIYDLFMDLIKDEDKPLDHYSAYDIQPRGKSFCFCPNLVHQYPSFSNIVGRVVNYDILKMM